MQIWHITAKLTTQPGAGGWSPLSSNPSLPLDFTPFFKIEIGCYPSYMMTPGGREFVNS